MTSYDVIWALKEIPYGHVWTSDVIQRVVTLSLLMFATLLGNTIIIVVLTCSKYRKVNSRVNIFIINLAVGDLTVCCVTMTTEVYIYYIQLYTHTQISYTILWIILLESRRLL